MPVSMALPCFHAIYSRGCMSGACFLRITRKIYLEHKAWATHFSERKTHLGSLALFPEDNGCRHVCESRELRTTTQRDILKGGKGLRPLPFYLLLFFRVHSLVPHFSHGTREKKQAHQTLRLKPFERFCPPVYPSACGGNTLVCAFAGLHLVGRCGGWC